jgi:parallel beta-helix repeat protein
MSFRLVLTAVLTAGLWSSGQAGTIYVDDDNCPGPGSGDPSDPYCSIQTAIDSAVDTDEIVVAPGTYFETIDFQGKAIWLHSSNGPELTIIDAQGAGSVVTCDSGEGAETVLDGFTITNGSPPSLFGGGMHNYSSSPTVTNCTFSGNAAYDYGGGMYNYSSSPTVTNCTFSDNSANNGGGMYSEYSSNATVINCTFSGNTAGYRGSGMFNYLSSPTVTDCTFSGNSTYYGGGMFNLYANPTVTGCTFSGDSVFGNGGGMFNDYANPTVTNCTFSGNTAAYYGGGMVNGYSSPTMANCTFSGNTAGYYGGGMYNYECQVVTVTNGTFGGNSASFGKAFVFDSFEQQDPGNLHMANSILWDGGDEIWNNDGSTITITYSDVQGGWPGPGNIVADPMFVDAANGDYHLQTGSPCLDAGHNWAIAGRAEVDLDGNPRFADGPTADTGCGLPVVVDQGAYEYQGEPFPVKLGDLDGDGAVGVDDFLLLLAGWGACVADCCLPDLDLDGDVGVADFLILLAQWG